MSGFGHPCLTFSITQRSTLPPANSYKDVRVQSTSIHTSKYSFSLCSKCRASHYAPSYFLRFEIGCGQTDDLSSDKIAFVCSRRGGGGSLFYPTNIAYQFSPLFRRKCGRSVELAMLKRKASRQDVTNNIC